jgi:hypothetical protein
MRIKTKKIISLSNSQKQKQHNKEIIKANAKRFNKQAEENLKFQAIQ